MTAHLVKIVMRLFKISFYFIVISANMLPQVGAGPCMSKACKNIKSAINGYEEFTIDGKNYRIYGDMKGMTPREYIDSWGKPLTNGHFRRHSASAKKHSPPKRSASAKKHSPQQGTRRSARIAERESKKRRASMGGSRKNNKTRKQRK